MQDGRERRNGRVATAPTSTGDDDEILRFTPAVLYSTSARRVFISGIRSSHTPPRWPGHTGHWPVSARPRRPRRPRHVRGRDQNPTSPCPSSRPWRRREYRENAVLYCTYTTVLNLVRVPHGVCVCTEFGVPQMVAAVEFACARRAQITQPVAGHVFPVGAVRGEWQLYDAVSVCGEESVGRKEFGVCEFHAFKKWQRVCPKYAPFARAPPIARPERAPWSNSLYVVKPLYLNLGGEERDRETVLT